MKKFKITIGWLYPELMSTYGDRGNIICLKKRCEWRGIGVEVRKLNLGNWLNKSHETHESHGKEIPDLLFMGGGEDWQQKIVGENLRGEKGKKSKMLREMIERGIPGLFICGAYQFMGKYYKAADGTKIQGLGIMDHWTVNPGEGKKRLIGNIIINITNKQISKYYKSISNFKFQISNNLVGFENHGGRTYLGEGVMPLGKVIKGFGNNGEDKTEGAVYKNIIGTYLHGPVLPKNPHLADWLIKKALERKYENEVKLEELDDTLEWQAHMAILTKLKVKN